LIGSFPIARVVFGASAATLKTTSHFHVGRCMGANNTFVLTSMSVKSAYGWVYGRSRLRRFTLFTIPRGLFAVSPLVTYFVFALCTQLRYSIFSFEFTHLTCSSIASTLGLQPPCCFSCYLTDHAPFSAPRRKNGTKMRYGRCTSGQCPQAHLSSHC